MKTYRFFRRFVGGSIGILGHAVEREDGWRFIPNISGRSRSRKSHPTMERCLPRWVGYPDGCESELIYPDKWERVR